MWIILGRHSRIVRFLCLLGALLFAYTVLSILTLHGERRSVLYIRGSTDERPDDTLRTSFDPQKPAPSPVHDPGLLPMAKEIQPGEPVLIHILAYQRTASSIISKLLGTLPGQFYMFEPLDMTFSAMYGTDPGWTIPSDIFNTQQAEPRQLPEDEVVAMRWTMDTIYQCQMADSWPLQFLLHPFWFHAGNSAIASYSRCLKNVPQIRSAQGHLLTSCMKHLRGLCRGRFAGESEKLLKCKSVLWRNGAFAQSVYPKDVNTSGSVYDADEIEQFDDYFQCLKQVEESARLCARTWLDKPCKESHIRIIKTVRSSMDIPEEFLATYPNFRLIHLFRDPRGVSKSRLNVNWAKGAFEGKNLTNIAKVYCQNVVSDYRLRRRLESQYPGEILQVISDDFMLHSLDYIAAVGKLMGADINKMKNLTAESMSKKGIQAIESIDLTDQFHRDVDSMDNESSENDTIQWNTRTLLETHSVIQKDKLGGESRLNMWQETFKWQEVKDIERVCGSFFKEIHYDWHL